MSGAAEVSNGGVGDGGRMEGGERAAEVSATPSNGGSGGGGRGVKP